MFWSMRFRVAPLVSSGVLALSITPGCGDDDATEAPDFTVADLEGLSFSPDELPGMEYQADSSGQGAFVADQEDEAKNEGDKSGLELVDRLERLGLKGDYVSQFFATNRKADLGFVESITFLFENVEGAEAAVSEVSQAAAENTRPAEEIDAPDLGEQVFGLRGEFDGFPTYTYGWRVGDAIQLVGAALGDPDAGPGSALELAEQLEAKAEG